MSTRNGGAIARLSAPSSWLVAPALVFFLGFAIIPLLIALGLSFTSWDGLTAPVFNGISNWVSKLTDPVTYNALWLSLQVIVFSWIVQTPLSLLLGVFTAGRQKYRAVLAALYFLPLILSSAAIAIAYKALLDPNYGIGKAFNLPVLSQDWLGNPALVLYVVIFVIAWQFIPFHSLLYQAGARQIPASLYEAAQLDGAGRVKQFFYITVPQLKNTIIASSTLMVVGSLTYFDIVYILTQGGPGYATRLLPLDMYLTGFSASDLGGASVLAVILVVIGLLLAAGLTKFSGFNRMSSQQDGA
ncbi:carbohydrate ABC transporter permease [Plantibacter sp. Mn2098]|uniref:carbohydrate ABC transporter permease n=1 Tax=Plantibacter sp. Mn2098 TaxID=3395266 RepID=UPI003BBA8C25